MELLFTVSPAADTVTVTLRYGEADRDAKASAASMPRLQFIAEIADAAETVFRKLIQVVPENREGYESVLRQIDTLRQSLA